MRALGRGCVGSASGLGLGLLVLGAIAAAEASLPVLEADWRCHALLRGVTRAWGRVRARRRLGWGGW